MLRPAPAAIYPAIVISDLHWTEAPADEYRWKLVKEIADRQKAHAAPSLIVLGDITDAKDRHSALMIWKVLDAFQTWANVFSRIYILCGNHDYLVDPLKPFFGFLGGQPRITFLQGESPEADLDPSGWVCELWGGEWHFIPHTRSKELFSRCLEWVGERSSSYRFMHQTMTGSRGANGYALSGIDLSATTQRMPLISGDVHVPQRIGSVEYVGAPYPIAFGDEFRSRYFLLKGPRELEYHPLPTFVRKRVLVIRSMDEFKAAEVHAGDRLKIEVEAEDSIAFATLRDAVLSAAEDARAQVQAVTRVRGSATAVPLSRRVARARTMDDVVRAYAAHDDLPDSLLATGLDLLP
jgi:hypothetical protein